MKSKFLENVTIRTILILMASALLAWFYNGTIAWNFNLPNIGFWEFFLGMWAIRICRCAICNFIDDDP